MRNAFQWLRERSGRFFPDKDPKKIVLRLLLYGFALVAIPIATLIILVWMGFFGKLPDKQDLRNIENPLASEVYSADSVLLGRYFVQERSFLKSSDIPESLKKTLVATEDIRFYRHGGIDFKSLGRVLVKSILLQKESSGGGSTLTQQLAKNLFPRRSYAILSLPINKIREYIIALRLESVYTKDELLVLYLNTIPFADNTYGVKTAAERFFSVPVKKLTWDQAAVLVGMLKATHYYNPRLFPERALKRRNVVLSQLARYEFLSEHDTRSLQEKPLGLRYSHVSENAGQAPYFRAFIQKELFKWCEENTKEDGSRYDLYRDGLKIYTTIDSRLQAHAENAMRAHMKGLQEKFNAQLSQRKLDEIVSQKIRTVHQYKMLKNDGLPEKEILARLKKPVQTKIFTWDGEKEVTMSIYDSLRHHITFLQTGVLAMDPESGNMLAYIGGIDHSYFKFDHVRESTKRQIGSTFKPLVYAAALERGIDPCSYISARKTVYKNVDDWAPENTAEETYEMKYSMQGGLEGSVNTVSVKLIEKAGIDNAIMVARKMGVNSELPQVPSLALGTASVSVKEMVAAYAVFANHGRYVQPRYLLSITDRRGKVLEKFPAAKTSRAISASTAQLMTEMLKGVVASGTAASLRSRYGVANDLAGKTGTTQSNVDGWFIAYNPRLVVGAWVGADDPRIHFRSTAMGQGAATALPIVAGLFRDASKDRNLREIMTARFPALPEQLADKLDCKPSKSDKNLFERIFQKKKKKKAKVTKFRGLKRKGTP